LGYVFFQYAVPWLVTQYRLFKEKQKRLDELILRNQKLREVLEKAEGVLKGPRGEENDEGVAAVGGDFVQSSRLPKPKPGQYPFLRMGEGGGVVVMVYRSNLCPREEASHE
jgi:hypothetical protein